MRAPFQEGDFPGPVKYGYLNVGVVEAGPDDLRRPHRLLPLPAPDGVRRAGRGGHGRARRRARRAARCWPAPSRPRSTRCGTPGRWSATGSPSSAPAWSGCCVARLLAGIPGVDGDPRRHRRRPRAEVAEALGRRLRAPGEAPRRPRPRRPRQRHRRPGSSSPSTCSAPTASSPTSAGTATRPVELYARRPVPLGAARHPGQPGRRGRRRRGAAGVPAPTGWRWPCRLLADPAFDALLTGESPFDELPEVMGKLASGSHPGAVPHDHLRPIADDAGRR